jgi:putative FmdB family regulatory protein
MPIYDFRCEICHHVFDKLTAWDVKRVACPECHGVSVRMPVPTSPPVAIFKAGGFTRSSTNGGRR